MSAPTPDSVIDKAALAVSKLQGCEDWHLWSITIHVALGHTWDYVDGNRVLPPDSVDPKHEAWMIEDRNAHRRLFLALSDNVKQTILLHADSHVSELFSALKSQYEHTGISAEFYAKQDYKSARLSNYDTIGDFITGLTNLTHILYLLACVRFRH